MAFDGGQLLQAHGQPTAGDVCNFSTAGMCLCCRAVLVIFSVPTRCVLVHLTTLALATQNYAVASLVCLEMQALAKYKQIHLSNPLNVECLRYLVHICGELGELQTMSWLTACWLCRLPMIAVAFFTHVCCVFHGLLVTWAASSFLGCLACRRLRQLPTDKQACTVVKDQHKVSCCVHCRSQS